MDPVDLFKAGETSILYQRAWWPASPGFYLISMKSVGGVSSIMIVLQLLNRLGKHGRGRRLRTSTVGRELQATA